MAHSSLEVNVLLSIYYMPAPIFTTGDKTVNRINTVSDVKELTLQWEKESSQFSCNMCFQGIK